MCVKQAIETETRLHWAVTIAAAAAAAAAAASSPSEGSCTRAAVREQLPGSAARPPLSHNARSHSRAPAACLAQRRLPLSATYA
jgi:hypothetical protein